MNIYIKTINTRFNPLYIAIGNQGSIAYVEEDYQEHYDSIACYGLPLNEGKINGVLTRSANGFVAAVTFEYKGIAEENKAVAVSAVEGVAELKGLLATALKTHEGIIRKTYPDFMEKEEQLALFE